MARSPRPETDGGCSWELYSTSACHLCEQAVELLEQQLGPRNERWQERDIIEDEALVDRYGLRIPVLRHRASGRELGWPFDADTLRDWLQRAGAGRARG